MTVDGGIGILPRAKKHATGMFFTLPSVGPLSSNPIIARKKEALLMECFFFLAKIL